MRVDPYWIKWDGFGRLAIMPRPRPNDWLEDELMAWKRAGIDVVVSCLMSFEAIGLGLEQEKAICKKIGLRFISFPIRDRDVLLSRQATITLVKSLNAILDEEHGVAVHCRMGIGRSALICASVLIAQGVNLDSAFEYIAHARGLHVPDTPAQIQWVSTLMSQLTA